MASSTFPSRDRLSRSLRSGAWFYALAGCFLFILLLTLHLINDSDLGFHLKGGQWILENHRIPSRDTYTYTVAGRPYLDIHWLYQVMLYLLYRLGGYKLLSLANTALILASFAWTWKRLRLAGAPLWVGVPLMAAAALASEIRFRERPEVASWLLMVLTLWVLDQRFHRKRDLLFLLPLLQLAWVNIESLFAMGWGLMAFYWVSGYLHSGKPDRKLLRYSLLALALDLVNPNFLRGLLYPFHQLAMLATANVFKYTVQELQPPWSHPIRTDFSFSWYLLAYKAFSILLFILFLATFRRRKVHEGLLVIAFFGLSVSAMRNVPLFMLSCLPVAASAWMDLDWKWAGKARDNFFSRPLCGWAWAVILLGFSARVVTNAYYVDGGRTDRFGLGLSREEIPVKACRFLEENRLDGRILNQLDSGGWLDWQGPPGQTFVDGRLEVMGTDFYDEYMRSLEESGPGLAPLLSKYRPDILFFKPIHATRWILDLAKMPGWRLVHLDPAAAVYLREGYADKIPALDEESLLKAQGIPSSILQQAPALVQAPPPSAWEDFLEGFVRPSAYSNGLLDLGIFSTYAGHPAAAEAFFLEDIRRTHGRYPAMFFDLGCLYDSTSRPAGALACMRRVLRAAPGNAFARHIVDSLGSGR